MSSHLRYDNSREDSVWVRYENEPQDTAHEVCFSPSLDNATAGCSAPVLARAGFSTPMATATTCATTRSRLWHAILSWTPCAISTLCFWRGRPVLATRRRFLNLQRLRRHGGIPTAVNRERVCRGGRDPDGRRTLTAELGKCARRRWTAGQHSP